MDSAPSTRSGARIALDPDHAGAHAGLARGLLTLGFLGAITHQEARSLALAEANRALALDPDSAEAACRAGGSAFLLRLGLGRRRSLLSARDRAQHAALRAPARSTRATWRRPAGAKQSIAEAAQAAELDPMSASAASTRALMLYYAARLSGRARRHRPCAAARAGFGERLLRAVAHRCGARRPRRGDRAPTSGRWPSPATARRTPGARTSFGCRRFPGRPPRPAPRWRGCRARSPHGSSGLGQPSSPTRTRPSAIGRGRSQLLEKALSEREPDILWLAVDPRRESLRAEPRSSRFSTSSGSRGNPSRFA